MGGGGRHSLGNSDSHVFSKVTPQLPFFTAGDAEAYHNRRAARENHGGCVVVPSSRGRSYLFCNDPECVPLCVVRLRFVYRCRLFVLHSRRSVVATQTNLYRGTGKDKRALQNLMEEGVRKKLIREKGVQQRSHNAPKSRSRHPVSTCTGGRFPRSAMPKSNYAAVL